MVTWHTVIQNAMAAKDPVIVPGIGANVFDQSANLFSVLGNYLLAPNFLVSAGYTYFKGDLDSIAPPITWASCWLSKT